MLRMRMAALLVLALAACSNGRDQGDGGRERRLARASQGLCDAQTVAVEVSVFRAREVFDTEVHAFLHELAADLQETDRAAAGELLEAKQRVEGILDEQRAEPQEVIVLIAGLQRALGQAAKAAGLPTPLCREGAS